MSLELKSNLRCYCIWKLAFSFWYSSNSSWVMDIYFKFNNLRKCTIHFLWFMAFLLHLENSLRKHKRFYWGFRNGALHFCAFSSSRVKSQSISSLNSYIHCHLIFCSQLWNWEDQQAIRCNSERGFVVFNDVFDDLL